MSMSQFIALLCSVAHVHKDKAKSLFTSFSVQMHEGGPMGEEAWEETNKVDFRRFLLGAVAAMENGGRDGRFNLLFRIYDANDDGVRNYCSLHMYIFYNKGQNWLWLRPSHYSLRRPLFLLRKCCVLVPFLTSGMFMNPTLVSNLHPKNRGSKHLKRPWYTLTWAFTVFVLLTHEDSLHKESPMRIQHFHMQVPHFHYSAYGK